MIKIAPSLLAADFSKLAEEVKLIKDADMLHLDIMDGHFVPNLTFGPDLIASLRDKTSLEFDTHLMISNPGKYIQAYAEAGSDYVTFHLEATAHSHRVIQQIKEQGCKAGVSLNPATPLQELEYILPELDLVLLMTVNPGFGGQDYIPQSTEKVTRLVQMIKTGGYDVEIAVDGGIKPYNAEKVIRAGADVIVAGSAIFGVSRPAEAIADFRRIAESLPD